MKAEGVIIQNTGVLKGMGDQEAALVLLKGQDRNGMGKKINSSNRNSATGIEKSLLLHEVREYPELLIGLQNPSLQVG
jgi:hypothetical protein